MAAGRTLPVDIVNNIIYYATQTGLSLQAGMACGLKLLSVCQLWRRVGLPIVYRRGYIQSKTAAAADSMASKKWLRTVGVDKSILSTNLDLINQNKLDLHLRLLYVNICDFKHLVSFFSTVMIMANKNARCWYMLKDVEFRIVLPQEDNFGGNENNASRDASAESNRVAMFVKTMSHNMPNIMTVKVHGANNEPIAQTLGSELAKVYASQLQLLSSTVSLLATKTLHCPKLTHLELDLNSDAMAFLPEICAGSLVSLKLNSVPYDFSWRRFQNKGAEGDIVFGRLRQLQVSFDLATRYGANSESSRWRYNSNGRDMYVVRFPVLEKLFVFNLDDGSDLLYMDELPLVLKTLTLVNSYVFTKNISRIKLQSVDALNVGFLPLNNAQEFYEMTNKLFNESIACRHAGMRLLDLGFELDPCKIEWHNLSQLAMFGTTNIDNLSRLLSRLPKLKRVYIDQVVATEGTREDIQDPSSYDKDTAMLETEREYQVAITTKITALVLRRMGNGAVPDLVADKIEKLLMHTHLLKSLSCPRVVNERVCAFVDKNKLQFPHLQDLVVTD